MEGAATGSLERTDEELGAELALAQDAPPAPTAQSSGHEIDASPSVPLFLELACDNLPCDQSGRAPNAMLVIMGSFAPAIWDECGHTETSECSSNHSFLLDVELPDRFSAPTASIRVCCYDVEDMVAKTRVLIGSASIPVRSLLTSADNRIRLPLISPDHETVGFVTVAARSDHLSATLPERLIRGHFENMFSTMYRFHTDSGSQLIVSEIMSENRLSFTFPQLLLNLWMNEEKRLLDILLSMENLRSGDWESLQSTAVRRHMTLIETYQRAFESLAEYKGSAFKRSVFKDDRLLEFVPVNVHLQRMTVREANNRELFDYDVVTVGAFTALPHGYTEGGLHRQLKKLKELHSTPRAQNAVTEASNMSSFILGPGRVSQMARSVLMIGQLQEGMETCIERLLYNAEHRNLQEMMAIIEEMNVKAHKLSVCCEKSLVDEALATWDAMRCSASTSELRKVLPLNRTDAGQPPLSRQTTIGEDDDDMKSRVDGGNVRSVRATPTPRSHTPAPDLRDDSEPLDETSLNIRASTMCMTTKVQNLSPQEADWVEELRPSVQELQSAVGALDRIAKFTYGLLSLKEPSHTASQSYSVRYRRDVCFSHSLTATVVALQAKLWCQNPDPVFLRSLGSIGNVVATYVCYLSCYEDEKAMIEDMVVAVRDLRNVTFIIERFNPSVGSSPRIEGNRVCMRVILPVPDSIIESAAFLNTSVDESEFRLSFSLTPVFLNIGINQEATLAESTGSVELEKRINSGGAEVLIDYMKRFQRGQVEENSELQELAELLEVQVSSRKNKNVDVLHTSMRMCRLMHGLRFTSCRSAKDRTGMSVTLEQLSILELDHNLASQQVDSALHCMRSEGSRLHNCFKNIGIPKYALNSRFITHYPEPYRPFVGLIRTGQI